MAKYELLKDAETPAPPKPMSKSAAEALAQLNSIKDGQTLKITPDEGQTIASIQRSFKRVATTNKIKIVVYEVPEYENTLWVKKVK